MTKAAARLTPMALTVVAALLPFPATPGEVPSGPPVAIVEDLDGVLEGVALMDYLWPGQKLELAGEQRIVIGYLASCIEETIRGGRVVIGDRQSTVRGGAASRRELQCENATRVDSEAKATTALTAVFRKPIRRTSGTLPPADGTIYSVAPVVKLAGAPPRRVTIERLDQNAVPLTLTPTGSTLDLDALGLQLEPGGLYRISDGVRARVVRVSPDARSGAVPLLRRLIAL